jgi:hypothetical protein
VPGQAIGYWGASLEYKINDYPYAFKDPVVSFFLHKNKQLLSVYAGLVAQNTLAEI